MLNLIITNNLPEVKRLLNQFKVKRAYAFGSVCSDKFNQESDIDFLIAFQEGMDPLERGENWWTLLYALRDLFKRDVDLIAEDTLRNPYFIKSVNASKELIHGG
ncbi:MAG: nucleotidyltransferase domain-containing protein [Bacteroidetes bacterium]|nr:MAG: nucleotidyltransferase domain-containing protein [Bacteroidota bacterium]